MRPALAFILLTIELPAAAQTVTVDSGSRAQVIDGFGTCLSGTEGQQGWFQDLFYDDLGASILRVDLTPSFRSPWSDRVYNSPWYGNDPALPGPDNNNVRTYTSAADYTRSFGGHQAQIAVMGPDIDQNVLLFDFDADGPKTQGAMAQAGQSRQAALGGFKLYGSMWSPPPWLKVSSGKTYSEGSDPLPKAGTAWPFIWGGNFAGGLLDVSGAAEAQLDDGTGPTSALTQYSRSLAAWLRGFQQKFEVQFFAVSLQNEVNFEEFYNSCAYPLSSQYLSVLKAARAELDKYPDLAGIHILGPEDLMGGDGWGMWQLGSGGDVTHKNLQYLQAIAADPTAAAALYGFNIHGYAADGMSSAGASAKQWDWWANGWTTAPAAGLPGSVKGFTSYGKGSWMTETSGESTGWIAPASGFPSNGGFSIALKIHQALVAGRQSAWLYWQLTDGKANGNETLTDDTAKQDAPKYVAAKHFFRWIRPGAQRVAAQVAGAASLSASAFVRDASGELTVVLVNGDPAAVSPTVTVPAGYASLDAFSSDKDKVWQTSSVAVASNHAVVTVPGYGVVTLHGIVAGPLDAGVPGADASTHAPDAAGLSADAASSRDAAATDAAPSSSDAALTAQADGSTAGQVGSSCGCTSATAPLSAIVLVALASLLGKRRGSSVRAP